MNRISTKSFVKGLIVFITLLVPQRSFAGTSVNIPVGDTVYQDLERLEVKGFLDSAMLSTKPFSRLEGARLLKEAEEKEVTSDKHGEGIILRLKSELKDDLTQTGSGYLKPVDSVYIKALYAAGEDPFSLNINNNGDSSAKGGNLRTGLTLKGGLFDTFSLYLNPEYRLDNDSGRGGRGVLALGYINIDFLGATVELGRDSMWWGAGYHGDLIMTNNARPLDMIKITSQRPFLIPWIFRYLGLVKPTIFLTHLDKDRDFPRANLLGVRLDIKPAQHFQLGFNRVILFGGHGREKLGFSDWIKILTASNNAEHSNSPINGDQIASIDASYVYVNERKQVPFSGAKFYIEWGAEDSDGMGTPTGYANIYGVFLDEPLWLKDIDLRVEWANTARNARYGPTWYTHNIYTTGYRYGGDIIGHHMGTDARDLFLRVQYHAKEKAAFGIEGDWERSGIHSGVVTEKRWAGVDVLYYPANRVTLQGGVGYEEIKEPSSANKPGPAVWSRATFNF